MNRVSKWGGGEGGKGVKEDGRGKGVRGRIKRRRIMGPLKRREGKM